MRSDASYAALGVLVAWLAVAALASGAGRVEPAPSAMPAKPSVSAPPSAANLRALRDGERIDLNGATLAELELLPGIGPRLAQRILEARRARGRFGDVADLADVSGIGPAKLATLARLACAGEGCTQRSNVQTNESALTK